METRRLLAGQLPQALNLYASVLQDYPRSQLGAEAQYRIGFAYETGADDFARNPLNSGDRLHQETAIDHDFLAGGGHLRAFSRKAPGGSRKRAIASKAKRFPNL